MYLIFIPTSVSSLSALSTTGRNQLDGSRFPQLVERRSYCLIIFTAIIESDMVVVYVSVLKTRHFLSLDSIQDLPTILPYVWIKSRGKGKGKKGHSASSTPLEAEIIIQTGFFFISGTNAECIYIFSAFIIILAYVAVESTTSRGELVSFPRGVWCPVMQHETLRPANNIPVLVIGNSFYWRKRYTYSTYSTLLIYFVDRARMQKAPQPAGYI